MQSQSQKSATSRNTADSSRHKLIWDELRQGGKVRCRLTSPYFRLFLEWWTSFSLDLRTKCRSRLLPAKASTCDGMGVCSCPWQGWLYTIRAERYIQVLEQQMPFVESGLCNRIETLSIKPNISSLKYHDNTEQTLTISSTEHANYHSSLLQWVSKRSEKAEHVSKYGGGKWQNA